MPWRTLSLGQIFLKNSKNKTMLLYILDLLGTLAFAVTGAYKAKVKKLNIFGVIFLGAITAVGGGTFRDLIIGRTPLFYLEDSNYLLIAILASLVTFFVPALIKNTYSLFRFIDSIGLAVFVIIGVSIVQNHLFADQEIGLMMVISCTFLGMITGFGGGIVRDSIMGEEPYSLRYGSNYVLSSFLGSFSFLIISFVNVNFAMFFAFVIVIIFREILSPYGVLKRVLMKSGN